MKALRASPATDFFRINQFIHGQSSSKFTGILAVRLPLLKQFLRLPQYEQEQIDTYRRSLPQRQSPTAVLTEDGSWSTGHLREYPPSMCRAIAKAIQCQIETSHRNSFINQSLCEDLQQTDPIFWELSCGLNPNFDPYMFPDTDMRPDYMFQ